MNTLKNTHSTCLMQEPFPLNHFSCHAVEDADTEALNDWDDFFQDEDFNDFFRDEDGDEYAVTSMPEETDELIDIDELFSDEVEGEDTEALDDWDDFFQDEDDDGAEAASMPPETPLQLPSFPVESQELSSFLQECADVSDWIDIQNSPESDFMTSNMIHILTEFLFRINLNRFMENGNFHLELPALSEYFWHEMQSICEDYFISLEDMEEMLINVFPMSRKILILEIRKFLCCENNCFFDTEIYHRLLICCPKDPAMLRLLHIRLHRIFQF